MPISQKIIDQVYNAKATPAEKQMMLELLEIEDRGVFRFEAAYDKVIRDYIASQDNQEETE